METYLRDDSGNRRFKPVKVGRLNFDALRAERVQLFAEAKWLYQTGFEREETLYIKGSAKAYEAIIQAEKMVSDEAELMADKLREFFAQELGKNEDERFALFKFKMIDLFASLTGGRLAPIPLSNWPLNSPKRAICGESFAQFRVRKLEVRRCKILVTHQVMEGLGISNILLVPLIFSNSINNLSNK